MNAVQMEGVLFAMVRRLRGMTKTELRRLNRVHDQTFGYPDRVNELRCVMDELGLDSEGDYDELEQRAAGLLNYAETIGLL